LDLYVAHDGEAMRLLSMSVSEKLREAGLNVKVDITSASIKSQIKRANRNQASFVAICNLEEAKQNCVSIKSIGNESQSSRPSSVQKTMPIEQLANFLLIEKSKRRKKMI
jgi:histidyl-tRNA synthetase